MQPLHPMTIFHLHKEIVGKKDFNSRMKYFIYLVIWLDLTVCARAVRPLGADDEVALPC